MFFTFHVQHEIKATLAIYIQLCLREGNHLDSLDLSVVTHVEHELWDQSCEHTIFSMKHFSRVCKIRQQTDTPPLLLPFFVICMASKTFPDILLWFVLHANHFQTFYCDWYLHVTNFQPSNFDPIMLSFVYCVLNEINPPLGITMGERNRDC